MILGRVRRILLLLVGCSGFRGGFEAPFGEERGRCVCVRRHGPVCEEERRSLNEAGTVCSQNIRGHVLKDKDKDKDVVRVEASLTDHLKRFCAKSGEV